MISMINGRRRGTLGFASRTTLGLAMAALLWVAAGSAWAGERDRSAWPPRECREVGRVCNQEVRTNTRVCRDDCETGEAGATCREECKSTFQADRAACRDDVWDCAQAHLAPMDEVCVEDCREDFAETREDLRACRADCKEDVRAAIEVCRVDLASDSEALRSCIGAARSEGRLCSQDCHDEYTCAGEFSECLASCVIEE